MKKIILVLLCLSMIVLFDRTAQGEVRTWTSVDGYDRIEAELISINDYSVKLRRNDNNEVVTIDFRRLSKNDKEFINRYEIEQEKKKEKARELKAREDGTLRKRIKEEKIKQAQENIRKEKEEEKVKQEQEILRKEKAGEIRTWTSGQIQIKAELLGVTPDHSVKLRRSDNNKEIIVDIKKLSENDQVFVTQYETEQQNKKREKEQQEKEREQRRKSEAENKYSGFCEWVYFRRGDSYSNGTYAAAPITFTGKLFGLSGYSYEESGYNNGYKNGNFTLFFEKKDGTFIKFPLKDVGFTWKKVSGRHTSYEFVTKPDVDCLQVPLGMREWTVLSEPHIANDFENEVRTWAGEYTGTLIDITLITDRDWFSGKEEYDCRIKKEDGSTKSLLQYGMSEADKAYIDSYKKRIREWEKKHSEKVVAKLVSVKTAGGVVIGGYGDKHDIKRIVAGENEGVIVLQKKDGQEINFRSSLLSEVDKIYLRLVEMNYGTVCYSADKEIHSRSSSVPASRREIQTSDNASSVKIVEKSIDNIIDNYSDGQLMQFLETLAFDDEKSRNFRNNMSGEQRQRLTKRAESIWDELNRGNLPRY